MNDEVVTAPAAANASGHVTSIDLNPLLKLLIPSMKVSDKNYYPPLGCMNPYLANIAAGQSQIGNSYLICNNGNRFFCNKDNMDSKNKHGDCHCWQRHDN